ncbi:hypothetical protein [Streptomyces sodiiphilus]
MQHDIRADLDSRLAWLREAASGAVGCFATYWCRGCCAAWRRS